MNDTVLQARYPQSAWKRGDTAFNMPSISHGPRLTCEAIAPGEWESIAAQFDGICQEQTYCFSKLRWPSMHYEPRVFRIGDDIIGGTLMMIQKLPLGMGSIAISKWGPMLRDATRPDRLALYRSMAELLVKEYAVQRRAFLSILSRASMTAENAEFGVLRELGFRAGTNVPFPDRYLVNLQVSDIEQRAGFDQKWRYHLKRSESAGLTFERADAGAMNDFDRLYHAMSQRKKFPDYSAYNSLPALFEMDEPLRPELFLVRKDGLIVAGAVIFKAGDTASYMYGATTEEALPLRAGYFMHWHIIRWLKENTRTRWYDLGGTDGFTGLHQFKKGMVGQPGIIASLPPIAHYAASRWSLAVGCGAFAARDFILGIKHRLGLRLKDLARPDQRRTSGSG